MWHKLTIKVIPYGENLFLFCFLFVVVVVVAKNTKLLIYLLVLLLLLFYCLLLNRLLLNLNYVDRFAFCPVATGNL